MSGELHNRRILVVDDNPSIHEDFRKILAAQADDDLEADEALLFGAEAEPLERLAFEVDSAYQGQEAYEMVRQAEAAQRPYALALVDIRMPPGWDGLETIDRIWAEIPDIQIVVCTAYSDYSWNDILQRFGQTDGLVILKKPFDNVEVRQLASALTEKWNLTQLARAKVGELESRIEERTKELVERKRELEKEVAERTKAEQRLRHNAFHDPLTGLPNRALFMDRLKHVCEREKRRPTTTFGVLFLDLDRFKVINDGLGHNTGDHFLVEVAARLTQCLRPGDTVARIGGDEFTILLDHLQGAEEVEGVARRIRQALTEPIRIRDLDLFTTASIGIALGGEGRNDPEALLRDADTAMYHAKASGNTHYRIFDREMREMALSTLQLTNDLQRAIERSELRVEYQPIFSIETGELTGCEALLRWQHPERGLVPPYVFVPLAEENALISQIGEWVLRSACRQNREWQRQGLPHIYVSVNVSALQVLGAEFPQIVSEVLTEVDLQPQWLRLELTESALMTNRDEAIRSLQELSALGVRSALDDFGTGYSSMSYLQGLPIYTLKIDQSFVQEIGAPRSSSNKILKAVATLAECLGLEVTAEGVETAQQLEVLRSLGCTEGQGFFCAAAMPPQEFGAFFLQSTKTGTPVLERRLQDVASS